MKSEIEHFVAVEAEEMIAEARAVTPDEIERVAEGLAICLFGYDRGASFGRMVVEELHRRAAAAGGLPN